MKKPLSKLPNEKAQKELKQFLIVGYVCAAIAFVAFGFLSIIGFAAGARSFVLSNHIGNKQNPRIKQLKAASVFLVILSVVEFVVYYSAS